MEIEILKIFVSPGHNFFGHYGQPPGDHETVEVPEISCVAGLGIEGDRFFDYKPDYKGQITFFSYEVYADLCQGFGRKEKLDETGLFRRNVITRGIDLNELIHKDFSIAGVQFRGAQECSPCLWMESFHPGTEAALKGRGGLRAKILIGGTLRPGVHELTLDDDDGE